MEYGEVFGGCDDPLSDDCVTAAAASVEAGLGGIEESLGLSLDVGNIPATSASSFYLSAAQGDARSNIDAEAGCSSWHARAKNTISWRDASWGRFEFRSKQTSMARISGCAWYKATTHAAAGEFFIGGGEQRVDQKWPTSSSTCHQSVKVNATAASCSSPWFTARRGEIWIGTAGGTYYHQSNGNLVWRVGNGGEIDLKKQFN
jgi:hypothetical protein